MLGATGAGASGFGFFFRKRWVANVHCAAAARATLTEGGVLAEAATGTRVGGEGECGGGSV